MQALEGRKEFFGEGHIESGAIVAYKIGQFAGLWGDAKLDDGFGRTSRKFPRVSKQVLQYDTQEAGVAVGNHGVGDEDLDLSVGSRVVKFRGYCAHQGREIYDLSAQLNPFNAR
jgi:hypothetical protein